MRTNLISLCAVAAGAASIAGCGGSGGPGSTTTPTGKAAYRAVVVSGYQAQVAADKYVLPMLVASAPTGSGFNFYSMLHASHSSRSPLPFDADLNLYYATGTSGPTWTMSFFTDAAGAHSAGFAKVTLENAATFTTNYSSYPVTLDLSENITAGNLASHGTGKLVFTGSSGANTLTGVLDVPAQGIYAVLNMSLDGSGNVGGSLTVAQNGLTADLTGLNGTVISSFTGNAAVTPGDLSGTATINLLQGTYQLTLSDPSGLSGSGGVDSSHNLTFNYNDGTTLTLSNPITQSVTGPGSNGGGGGGSSYTIAPVNGDPSTIAAVSADGKMVGQIGTNPNSLPNYWTSPSATPQAVTLDSSLTNIVVTGVNASGHLVGSGLDGTTHQPVALYWSALNKTPVHLPTPALSLSSYQNASVFLQSTDRIVVTYPVQGSPNSVSYVFSGPTDTNPYAVSGGYILGMSDGTAALGVGVTNAYAVWTNLGPNATPIPVPEPQTSSIKLAMIGADGTIATFDLGTNMVWVVAGPSYTTKVALQPPVANAPIAVSGVGPTGHLLGTAATDQTSLDNEGLIWSSVTAAPVILRTTSTPNVLSADFETSSGILIVNGVDNPSGPTYRLSVMTPK